MCIVFFDWSPEPSEGGYKLVLAANRDEEYHRPAARAAEWPAHPGVFGGTDLQVIVHNTPPCP